MHRQSRVSRLLSSAFISVLLLAGSVSGQSLRARVVVYKNPTPDRAVGSPIAPFAPVASARLATSGFVVVADYTSRTLYEGPSAAAAGLVEGLGAEGYHAEIPADLDTVIFNDFRINADTGISVPPIPPSADRVSATDGLYIVAFRGYPTAEWIGDLTSRNVKLIETLPPAGYLVRGSRDQMSRLKEQVTYLRGVFPVTSSMKKVLFNSLLQPTAVLRNVFIQTAEASETESLREHLQTFDPQATEERRSFRVSYRAALSDLDIDNLTHFEQVYAISPIGESRPSSERQSLLVAQPVVNQTTGALSLPDYSIDYGAWLANPSRGITNFNNTRIAVIDTGFDNGEMTGANVHPDFVTAGQLECTAASPANCQDLLTHGTVTASIIGGYADFGPRWAGYRADNGQYRYGLGLAPRSHLIIERIFGCGSEELLVDLLNSNVLQARQPNLLNYSINSISQYGYNADSRALDERTRMHNWLFTVSAGNVVFIQGPGGGQQDLWVRPPATAKNVLAVGATENFTHIVGSSGSWPLGSGTHPEECQWSEYSPWGPPEGNYTPEDARNIPSFSAQRRDPLNFTMKPDLVAPGTRVTGPRSRGAGCGGSVFCSDNIDQFFTGTGLQFNYGFSAGTSWSAPAVAGAAAVARRWYNNVRGGLDPSPAMTKAMLINGARDIYGGLVRDQAFNTVTSVRHVTSDPYQGWGSLNLNRLLGPGTNYYFYDQATTFIQGGQTFWEVALTVRDSTRPTRITLVYTDAASAIGDNYRAQNDLLLVAYQTACFPCWYGNNISSTTGYTISTGRKRDALNNVEEIIIPAGYYPTGSTVRVYVSVENLVADALHPVNPGQFQQDFAVFVDNLY
jgi:Subtilase family